MDLFESISKRRTIRDFEPEEIEDNTIRKIIEAGFCAPTNDHMRDWHLSIIIILYAVNQFVKLGIFYFLWIRVFN